MRYQFAIDFIQLIFSQPQADGLVLLVRRLPNSDALTICTPRRFETDVLPNIQSRSVLVVTRTRQAASAAMDLFGEDLHREQVKAIYHAPATVLLKPWAGGTQIKFVWPGKAQGNAVCGLSPDQIVILVD